MTRSFKALSLFCAENQTANYSIHQKDFVLEFYAAEIYWSFLILRMIETSVGGAWFALASKMAFICSAKCFAWRWSQTEILWLVAVLPVICMQTSTLPVSEGKRWHQRSPRNRPSVTMTTKDGIKSHLGVCLSNIKVAPVTRISSLSVLEANISKTKERRKARKRTDDRDDEKFIESSGTFILWIHALNFS